MSPVLRRGSANIAMKIAEAVDATTISTILPACGKQEDPGMEAEHQLLLACDLQFIEPPLHEALQHQVVKVRKMLTGLIKSQSV